MGSPTKAQGHLPPQPLPAHPPRVVTAFVDVQRNSTKVTVEYELDSLHGAWLGSFNPAAYARDLLIFGSTSGRAAVREHMPANSSAEHRAQMRAYVWAVYQLSNHAPGVIEAAVELLDVDAVRATTPPHQVRMAAAAKLARHLLANLRLGAQWLYHDIETLYLDGQEASAGPAEADGAGDAAAHAAHGATARGLA